MVDHEDDTQDVEEDEKQLARVRDWIVSRHIDTVELTDVLSNFPDISVALTEEIIDKLVKEDLLSRTGRDIYTISKRKQLDPNSAVKEEMEVHENPVDGNVSRGKDEDYMYMKALYHALPMEYVSVAKLQGKLDGEANQSAVRKLIDKMAQDGFIESKGNRRLGKRVIRSELTSKKLVEVKNTLENKFAEMDISKPENKSNRVDSPRNGSGLKDISTNGGLHSVGSDITRTQGRSEPHEQAKMQDQGNTPSSRTQQQQPVASRESGVPGNERNGASNGRAHNRGEGDNVTYSRSSQDKRSRKASTVKEPILQNLKRQKTQQGALE